MKITFFGHGCFLIETGHTTFIIDPFISGNPLAEHIQVGDIACDFILLTHGHLDHVLDVEQIAKNTKAPIISNFEIVTWYNKKGLEGHGLNHGGWWSFNEGRIKYVSAVHSSVLPDGTYGGNPGGFVIEGPDGTLYISGDTALTMDMKLIPMMCKKLDAAILCIGDNFTMGIEDAILASDFIQCNTVVGAHYDTFAPISINHEEAVSAFQSKNKTLHLLKIGDALEI